MSIFPTIARSRSCWMACCGAGLIMVCCFGACFPCVPYCLADDGLPATADPSISQDTQEAEEAHLTPAAGIDQQSFAWALFSALAAEHPQENLVLAPVDLMRLLSLVHAGAAGETQAEIATALGFTPTAEAWQLLDSSLADAVLRPRFRFGLRAQNNQGYGLLITETLPGSPAEELGLQSHDLLLTLDGRPMRAENDFVSMIEKSYGTHQVQWYAFREGQVRSRQVVLQQMPADPATAAVQLNRRAGAWIQEGYPVLPAFAETLTLGFSSDVASVDFATSPEAAAGFINEWAGSHTAQKIPNLLNSEDLSSDTRLVLASVLAFQGPWESPFNPSRTRLADFHLADGSTVEVAMMSARRHLLISETKTDVAVELPFEQSFFSLTAILPKEPAAGEALFTADRWQAIRTSLVSEEIELSLPKIDLSFRDSVVSALQSLGMKLMFDQQSADLSGITAAEELYVGDVLHACTVRWDETGAEAAAASAATIVPRFAIEEVRMITFDQPFLFVISDVRSGTILFVGHVSNPSP